MRAAILTIFACCIYFANAGHGGGGGGGCTSNFIWKLRLLGAWKMAYLIEEAGLEETLEKLGPVTLFAVRDDFFPNDLFQFAKGCNNTLLTQILKYQLVSGNYQLKDFKNDGLLKTYNGGMPVRTNICFDKCNRFLAATVNGDKIIKANNDLGCRSVIHVTSGFMYPFPQGSVLDVIASDSRFTTFLYALTKTNLRSKLADGPVTMFAPTNKAFQKLAPGVYDDLVNNQTALTRILNRHIVSQTLYSACIYDGKTVKSCGGNSLNFRYCDKSLIVNNAAKVVEADMTVTNGVIHVVDALLMPLYIQESACPNLKPLEGDNC